MASALVEREASVRELQELEEKARDERSIPVKWTSFTKPSMAVIGQEAPAAKPSWVDTMDIKEQIRLKREVAKVQRMTLAQRMEKKLLIVRFLTSNILHCNRMYFGKLNFCKFLKGLKKERESRARPPKGRGFLEAYRPAH